MNASICPRDVADRARRQPAVRSSQSDHPLHSRPLRISRPPRRRLEHRRAHHRGSTTDQRFIADGETWQDVLAAEYRSHGKTVSVVNAGIDGQSTYGHLKDFDWWFPHIPGLRARVLPLLPPGSTTCTRSRIRASTAAERRGLGAPSRTTARFTGCSARAGDATRRCTTRWITRRGTFASSPLTSEPRLRDYDAPTRERLAAYRGRLAELARGCGRSGPNHLRHAAHAHGQARERQLLGAADAMSFGELQINGVDLFHLMARVNRATLNRPRPARVGVDVADGVEWETRTSTTSITTRPQGPRKIGEYLYGQLKDLP